MSRFRYQLFCVFFLLMFFAITAMVFGTRVVPLLPIYLVYAAALLAVITRWSDHPSVSLFVTGGLAGLIAVDLADALYLALVRHPAWSAEYSNWLYATHSWATSVLRAVGVGLVLVGAFIGRSPSYRQPRPEFSVTALRRYLRFSVRTLVVGVTIFCVWLGWFGWKIERARKQREAVAWVQKVGGIVVYDTYSPSAESTLRRWLREQLGHDFFDSVIWVNMPKGRIGNLTRLSGLTSVRVLDLQSTDVTDVGPLVKLASLEVLDLSDTLVEDVTPLSSLTSLKVLNLSRTHVSHVTPLAKLTHLDMLFLKDTAVSQADMEQLRTALTQCEIRDGS